MKTAHDAIHQCARFMSCIDGYIDKEIDAETRTWMDEHTSDCGPCAMALANATKLDCCLKGMKQCCVTPEFDFRLKSSIRLEHKRMKNAGYRLRRMFENAARPTVYAAAAVLFIAVSITGYRSVIAPGDGNMADVSNGTVETLTVEAQPDQAPSGEATNEEIIQYVLDSIKENEADMGVFLEAGTTESRTPASGDISMVGF